MCFRTRKNWGWDDQTWSFRPQSDLPHFGQNFKKIVTNSGDGPGSAYAGQGSGSLSYTAGPPTPALSRRKILASKFFVIFTAPCYSNGAVLPSYGVCLSVRLWRWWALITYVELGGILLHAWLAKCLRSPYAKFQRSSAKGTFSNLWLNRGGEGKIGDFQPISRRISETVRDRAKVTIDH